MNQNKMLRMAAMAQLHLHGALWVTRNKVGYWYAHIEKPILNEYGIWIRKEASDQCVFLMSDDDKSDESILCLSIIEMIYPSIAQTSPPEDITKEIYNIENGVKIADFCGEIKN